MEQVLEYIKRAHQGDKAARDLLVQNNLGLVWSIVRRFSNRGYDPEDLFQVGSIGLLKAIDRFDTDYEVKFSTYAVESGISYSTFVKFMPRCVSSRRM